MIKPVARPSQGVQQEDTRKCSSGQTSLGADLELSLVTVAAKRTLVAAALFSWAMIFCRNKHIGSFIDEINKGLILADIDRPAPKHGSCWRYTKRSIAQTTWRPSITHPLWRDARLIVGRGGCLCGLWEPPGSLVRRRMSAKTSPFVFSSTATINKRRG